MCSKSSQHTAVQAKNRDFVFDRKEHTFPAHVPARLPLGRGTEEGGLLQNHVTVGQRSRGILLLDYIRGYYRVPGMSKPLYNVCNVCCCSCVFYTLGLLVYFSRVHGWTSAMHCATDLQPSSGKHKTQNVRFEVRSEGASNSKFGRLKRLRKRRVD